MRPRTVALGAFFVLVAVVAVIAILAGLVIVGLVPRSVIGDIAYPLPTPLPAQPACPLASASDPLCIIILGDSTAAGIPLAGDDRWWRRMEAALAAGLPDRQVAVANWAVPRGRVDVLESAAEDQPALESFDIAIILEGVNDVDHTPIDEWARRYQASVEQIEARGLEVIIAAPPANFENGTQEHRHDEVDDAVRAMAKPDRPLLDIAARFRADGDEAAASYYADNLHQADGGQQVIAEMATGIVLGLQGTR